MSVQGDRVDESDAAQPTQDSTALGSRPPGGLDSRHAIVAGLQATVGNRTISRTLAGGRLQRALPAVPLVDPGEVTEPVSGVFEIIGRGTVTVANDVIPEATAVVATEGTAAGSAAALGTVAAAGFVLIGAIVVAGAIFFAVKLAGESHDLDEHGGNLPPGGAPPQAPTLQPLDGPVKAGGQSLGVGKFQPMAQAQPATDEDKKRGRVEHRGNIHCQGPDIPDGQEPNYSWQKIDLPMTKLEGAAALTFLKGQCTDKQLKNRVTIFPKVEKFIQSTLYTAPPPLFKSFFDTDPKTRVDVEIIQGAAFA